MHESVYSLRMPRECWALSLGNCEGPITKEHYVSASYFDTKTIMVRGLPAFGQEPVELPVSGLSRGMLCRKHNNELGQHVDSIASRSFQSLDKCEAVFRDENAFRLRHYFPVHEYISGTLLERWFAKTLINLAFGQDAGIGPLASRPGWPSDDLVRVAFGLDTFHGDAGLYWIVKPGDQITLVKRLQFRPVCDRLLQDNIVGCHFALSGYQYFLELREVAEPRLASLDTIRRLERLVYKTPKPNGKLGPSVVIHWQW